MELDLKCSRSAVEVQWKCSYQAVVKCGRKPVNMLFVLIGGHSRRDQYTVFRTTTGVLGTATVVFGTATVVFGTATIVVGTTTVVYFVLHR